MKYDESDYQGKTGVWHLRMDPKPIPIRSFDWDFWHDDYDGPEDGRHGSKESREACIEAIKEIEEDE
jgi:hypothetical protein